MAFPKNAEEAQKMGYRFLNSSHCRGCGVAIEWWKTPNGKHMPVSDPETFLPHWADCPKANQFRSSR